MQLRLGRPPLLRRLPLEQPERPQLRLGRDDLLDRRRAQRPDQLVLQVGVAAEEPPGLQPGPGQPGAEAGALQAAAVERLLGATVLAGTAITNSNKGRLAVQSGFRGVGAAKAALTVVGTAATAFAAYSGNKISQASEAAVSRGEQFEVKNATESTEKTPAEVAVWQRRQRVAQYVVPATTGALVVLNSYLVQSYRPGATVRGILGRLTSR